MAKAANMAHRSRKLSHERAVLLYCLLGGVPAVTCSLVWVWSGSHAPEVRGFITILVVGSWIGFAFAAQERVIRPLQTMSNLLLALREGDFSFRARGARHNDPLGDVLSEINSLSDILQTQRRGAIEASALLTAAIKEIDVAIFAFDANKILRLVNPAGQELLGQAAERLIGREAKAIGLEDCLEGEPNRILSPTALSRAHGRWSMRRTTFREDGRPHQLIVFGDLSRPLREEQLKSWQRLVRVLGHELNNSLAPIKSIAATLGTALERKPRAADWEEDLQSGLGVIASRAESLERFLQGYTRLARLPPPQESTFHLGELLRRAATLEHRLAIRVKEGPAVVMMADEAQIEHAVINLVKNAVEASIETAAPRVQINWRVVGEVVEISVADNGAGIGDTANLFVPFFTTKAEGSGIGLVLCQQIAENHGGSIALYNRDDRTGCVAVLRLPLRKSRSRSDQT